MKILIDIGHPAHVHYFKNLIQIMKKRGHKFCVVSRDKEVTHSLLESYGIDYISRGKGAKSLLGKFLYLFKANYIIYKIAKKFKPDIFLSFASPYAAHVSYILRKEHIAYTDTEHAKLGNIAFSKFTNTIVTPDCLPIDFGHNHIKFNGYMELSYLHPNYFKPDKSILEDLKINASDNYILIRFVSWDASHDFGKNGLSYHSKIKLVKKLSKNYKVFISSEGELPKELEKHKVKIPHHKMHDFLNFCSLFIGEGATMASECVMLGVPAIYINTIECSTCTEQEERYNLLYNYRVFDGVIEKAFDLLKIKNKAIFQQRSKTMIKEKIDVTMFMVYLLENFPKSRMLIRENPKFNKFNSIGY